MKESSSNSRSGIGVGSASVILIFAVLCLTVFTLITYIVASNNKTLVDNEAALVTGYYKADALAARVLSGILAAEDTVPAVISGVEIVPEYDSLHGGSVFSYRCPVSDIKALDVSVLVRNDSYDILSWCMVDTVPWSSDGSINIWDGG